MNHGMMKNLNLISYCNNRVSDIDTLLKALPGDNSSTSTSKAPELLNSSGNTIIRHKRRRTTSHFKFRVSRCNINSVYLTKRKHQKLERCRKHVRRPAIIMRMNSLGLSTVYGSGCICLGTHMFNSKRMKMVKRWGYCLPLRHASRGLSVLKDVLRYHCTLADRSYYRPIDIKGHPDSVLGLIGVFLVMCHLLILCLFKYTHIHRILVIHILQMPTSYLVDAKLNAFCMHQIHIHQCLMDRGC